MIETLSIPLSYKEKLEIGMHARLLKLKIPVSPATVIANVTYKKGYFYSGRKIKIELFNGNMYYAHNIISLENKHLINLESIDDRTKEFNEIKEIFKKYSDACTMYNDLVVIFKEEKDIKDKEKLISKYIDLVNSLI